jgi:GNAT superfamily N-acetyltransferase
MAIEIKEINWRIPFALRNHGPNYMTYGFDRAAEPSTTWWGLYVNGDLVSFGRLDIPQRGACTLGSLWTMPEYRGNGYGKMLVDYRLNLVVERDVKTITRASNVYEKFGFVNAGIVAQRDEGTWFRMILKRGQPNKLSKRAIIIDIDETLVDSEGNAIKKTLEWIDENRNGRSVIVLTARGEESRGRTEASLKKVGLKYDDLFMSSLPAGAYVESKRWRVNKLLEENYILDMAIDDDPDVRSMYKSLGIGVVVDPVELNG